MKSYKGFTLVELVIVILLIGIVSITLGNLYTQSILSFLNLNNSVNLVDDADLIQRQFFQDIRNALPNSVRITTSGTKTFLEFIPIKTSGKYKSIANSTSGLNPCSSNDLNEIDNDILSFNKSDTCFKSVGHLIDNNLVTNQDFLVVYNVGNGESNADAYSTGNRTNITSVNDLTAETKINFGSILFPYDSMGNIFYIVTQPVTYECDTASKTLRKYTNYGFNPTQSTSYTSGYLISNHISSCNWTYNNLINLQKGLVVFKLGMTMDSASIMLVNSVNIGNTP